MKKRTLKKSKSFVKIGFTLFVLSTILNSCKKDLSIENEISQNRIELPISVNPFSLRNVEKAKVTLANQNQIANRFNANLLTSNEKKFIYFKFNPQDITQEQFLALENDTTMQLMEIPFANMALYTDEFTLDSTRVEQLKDGSVYGVTAIENTNVFTKLSSRPETKMQYLDTLVKIAETDTALQYQAFREAGATEQQIARFRICLFKRPKGFVNYFDNQMGRLERVRGMQVWSLYLGIPITTYTDGNGYYEIPWLYNIGSIMGTKAKNNRVNVKPLDTRTLSILFAPALISQFIVGSVHIEGFVTPCQMKDGKDFNFYGHTQVRYWSQILNAYYFHDQYSDAEGITKAPNSMVCYAQWARIKSYDNGGVPNFGNASTPMLGHIPGTTNSLIVQYFMSLFGGQNITNNPNLFNLLTGLLPDMTFRVPFIREPQFYNSRLSQFAFHELSHASHYNRVGNLWWTAFIGRTLGATPIAGNPYGNASNYIDVGESWAEFLGTNFAMRRYIPENCIKDATNSIGTITSGNYYRMDNLIENEFWYFGGRWMPYGCYHDLIDAANTAETWDAIQGVSIQQMYNSHNSKIISMCNYRENFAFENPTLNQVNVDRVFNQHNAICR
jgi:hypothetical protein